MGKGCIARVGIFFADGVGHGCRTGNGAAVAGGGLARCGGSRGALVPASGPGLGAGLFRRRGAGRAVWPGLVQRSAGHPAPGRAGCGAVPVPDRPGDAAQPPVVIATADLRPGQRADPGLHGIAHGDLPRCGPGLAGGLHRRLRFRAHLHRGGDAAAGRTWPAGHPSGPADCLHPAVRGLVDRAIAGPGRMDGTGRRTCRGGTAVAAAGSWPAGPVAVVGCRALVAGPAVCAAGPGRCARGDDRRCLAGGAGRGPVDAVGWAVDGDGRFRGRCAAQ